MGVGALVIQLLPNGKGARCEHRWAVKECPECLHENDITARDCESCGEELINPNDKLKEQFPQNESRPTKNEYG